MKENYAIHVLKRELKKAERYMKGLKGNPAHFMVNEEIAITAKQIHDLKSGIKKLEGK